jgi:hypothetical protein
MVSNEERLKVLKMISEGKITPDEGAQLLTALDEGASGGAKSTSAPSASPTLRNRWFRVRVTDSDTGKVRVNVRLPLSMVSAGIKMGMRFTPQVEGLDMDQLIEIIQSGEMGQIVDVQDDEDGEHVEVYIE